MELLDTDRTDLRFFDKNGGNTFGYDFPLIAFQPTGLSERDWDIGYGKTFDIDAFAGAGAGNQLLLVVPSLQLIIFRNGEKVGEGAYGPKAGGMLMLDKVLYMLVRMMTAKHVIIYFLGMAIFRLER